MIYRSLKFLVLTCAIAAMAQVAGAQNRPFEVPPGRTAQSGSGPLTLPSTASFRAVLAQFLRGQGRDEATADSIVESSRAAGRQGITHVQFEQRAGGLPVYSTYAKAAFSARGELISVIENLATVPRNIARAEINAQQAITAAIANLYPALRTVPPGFFRNAPSATRVAIPDADGSMSAGFLVETWTDRSNQLHETLVSGTGAILFVESRTNTQDQYNVFRINPETTPQTVTPGPGAGNAESPAGWLFGGTQGATKIAGNNVHAYLDVISDNRSDANGTPVTNGSFLTIANLDAAPSTPDNRAVAVQNLFFLNNLIHDELYRHGFTEGNLNFQENNFGRGGRGSDSVNAEAQDGGGTDNANFSTPRDGSNPRMQMYLWTGAGPSHYVLAGGQTFGAHGAEFGPALNTTGRSGTIRLVNDGVGTGSDGCEAFSGVAGAIALIDRGTCAFTVKVKNAQNAGAVAAIVANNTGTDEIMTMGGSDTSITIPSVFVSFRSGGTLKAMGPTAGTVKRAEVQPLQRDGDLDADIVFHEYCHGLTWRMIGGMNGPIAGAIGEGMSDICAMLLTARLDPRDATRFEAGSDAIGEYSFSNPAGIRRYRYDGYPRTYGQIEGASVHDDGEVYGAIGWRLLELFGESRKDDLFGYLVDGMNYTPSTPTYEQMRDGILQSVAATPFADAGDRCKVWSAFAQYGVGVGAKATVRRTSLTITQSFAVPAGCTLVPDSKTTP